MSRRHHGAAYVYGLGSKHKRQHQWRRAVSAKWRHRIGMATYGSHIGVWQNIIWLSAAKYTIMARPHQISVAAR